MDTGELLLLEDLSVWDRLLNRSPQNTRYLERDFLSLFNVDIRYYGMFKNGTCIAGIPKIDSEKYGGSTLPWCYYQGPVFYDEIYRSSASRLTQYVTELTEQMTTQLATYEDQFYFSLNPNLTDVRGFDWVHYHDSERSRCQIHPRYTATLPIRDMSSQDIRKLARSARRQEEKYAIEREGLEVQVSNNISSLKKLYAATFHKQSKSVAGAEMSLLETFASFLLEKGWGRIIEITTGENTSVAAALLFEDVNGTWHVPIVGVGETRYGGTLLYYSIIDEAKRHGGSTVDFNGANSPQRGYFKHSFGALAKLYFEIEYCRQY